MEEFEGQQWGLEPMPSCFRFRQFGWHCQSQLVPGIRMGLGHFWGKHSKVWVHWGMKPGQEPICQGLREVLLVITSINIHLLVQIPLIKSLTGASLVAQWLRICLPMQSTRVRALVWEDPTCRGATGPVSHSCWACASGACAPQRERPR